MALKPLKHLSKTSTWPLYLDGLLMGALFISLDEILIHGVPGPWALAFLMGSYFYWSQAKLAVGLPAAQRELSFFFLAKSACLLALCFESGHFSYLGLLALPLLVGPQILKHSTHRSSLLIGSLIGLALVMGLSQNTLHLRSTDVAIFLALLAMGLGPVASGINENDLTGERLFFHDLVGEIHALKLYLEAHEKESDEGEIMAMVNSLGVVVGEYYKTTYGLTHRSLGQIKEEISFSECERELEIIVGVYLEASGVRVHKRFGGLLETRTSWEYFHLNKTNFRRLMVNICKNIAEADSSEVEFHFDGAKSGLHFEIRNNLQGLAVVHQDLDSKLGEVIKRAGQEERGLGLLSMAQVCEGEGGELELQFENGIWITKGFLPWRQEEGELLKSA